MNADGGDLARVLGIDMGGSATRAHLIYGSAARTWTAPGGNLTLAPRTAIEVLLGLVSEVTPSSLCIGVAGARTAPAATARLVTELQHQVPHVSLMSDAELAVVAAFGAEADGIVVCAGTGSVAAARKDGQTHVLGGHGFLLGDAGGAYDVGRRLVAAALRDRDRGSQTLVARVELLLGEPIDQFVRRVYLEPASRQHLARLAERVPDLDHEVAPAVLAEAAEALAALVDDARHRFGPLPVRMSGGVFRLPGMSEALQRQFDAQYASTSPEVAAAHVAAEALA